MTNALGRFKSGKSDCPKITAGWDREISRNKTKPCSSNATLGWPKLSSLWSSFLHRHVGVPSLCCLRPKLKPSAALLLCTGSTHSYLIMQHKGPLSRDGQSWLQFHHQIGLFLPNLVVLPCITRKPETPKDQHCLLAFTVKQTCDLS